MAFHKTYFLTEIALSRVSEWDGLAEVLIIYYQNEIRMHVMVIVSF